MRMMNDDLFNALLDLSLREDIGDGDHSSLSCIPEKSEGHARLLVKDTGIIAGTGAASRIFQRIDEAIQIEILIEEGSDVQPGDTVFTIGGAMWSILRAERLVLNVMQRMSGIATRTAEYVGRLEGLPTRILDTRKTVPGLRMLDKEAVRIGGGVNHRMGLYDMIMLKDNHIDFAGGIEKAINRATQYLENTGRKLEIEIEVRSIDDLRKVLHAGKVDRIMLDNFNINDTRAAVDMISGRYISESSGGITLKNLREYAECGVDFISVGALTHHVKSLDLSLKAIVQT